LSPFIRRKAYQIKIPKGQSEAMNLMTDNTMTKEKITYNDLQSLHRKLKIEEQELLNKLEVFWKEKQVLFHILVL
jgi:predicted HAD superfamily phosphohydrolase